MEQEDLLNLSLNEEYDLIIASDNSAGIGEKEADEVKVANEVASYFACRVAYMDLLRSGAIPKAIILQNFTNDAAWESYVRGIQQLLAETSYRELPITGSTESNFHTLQSAIGLTMIGLRPKQGQTSKALIGEEAFAVIGKPLVGEEVIEEASDLAPLSLYESLAKDEQVIDLMPVGSKGIAFEWRKLTQSTASLRASVDLEKSGGPSTCFILAYPKKSEAYIRSLTGKYFFPLEPVQGDSEK